MKITKDTVVLLTGANGGLGRVICRELAAFKVRLVLVAYPGEGLEAMRDTALAEGQEAISLIADLRDPEQRRSVAEQAFQRFGRVDLLINNAGVEYTNLYEELTEEQILEMVQVNLLAPMVMTRLVLPEMLRRGVGHIVQISSLAGKSGPACEEGYSATKAGLVGFTASLRASYRGTGVSASVICPGFVEAGIYQRLKLQSGCTAPALLGSCAASLVSRALVRAVESDLPEVIINRMPVRPILVLGALWPRLGEWAVARTGVHTFFRRVVANRAEAAKRDQQTAGALRG